MRMRLLTPTSTRVDPCIFGHMWAPFPYRIRGLMLKILSRMIMRFTTKQAVHAPVIPAAPCQTEKLAQDKRLWLKL